MSKKIVIELSFDDIVSDMFGDASHSEYGCEPASSFSEAVRDAVISQVVREVRKSVSDAAVQKASELAIEEAKKFIDGELKTILRERLVAADFEVRGSKQNLDTIISGRIHTLDPIRTVTNHIDQKSEAFAKEMKARYDNVFAMKIVQSLNSQKLLSPEVSKMLLGDENEQR